MILGDVGTDLRHILWYATTACEFALVLRLLFSRMVREYRFFFAYVLLSVLQSVAAFIVSRPGSNFGTNAYAYAWAFTEPVMIAALIAFTLECYKLVHHHYPGFDDDRPLISRIVIVGAVICLASLIPDLRASHWQPTLTLFLIVERTVTTLGAMLMALVLSAYVLMPALMPPNIMRHARLTFAYLLTNSIGYFGLNVFGSRTWSTFRMGACVLCFFMWTVMLTRQGQIEPEPGPNFEDEPGLELSWEELKDITQQAPRFRFRWFGCSAQKINSATTFQTEPLPPPGTSKWNKIEHRLFSFISQNWRGKPLISQEVIVNLIAGTTTKTGLTVRSELDTDTYPPGIKVSDREVAEIDLRRDTFHGDWNYTIHPTPHNRSA